MIFRLKNCFRTLCCNTYTSAADKGFINQSRYLQRMLDRDANRKKSKVKHTGLVSKGNLMSAYENDGSSVRLVALNKIYMQNLLPILSGGIYGNELAKLEVEVPRVRVNKTLEYVNIYWIAKNPNIPISTIEPVLQKALKELQLQLGTVRYIPKIPFVRFVRDTTLERAVQLEKIFEMADYGDKYEPVYDRKVFTPANLPNTGELAKMRMDVLSLDHERIKGKVMSRIFRYKAININGRSEFENEPVHEVPEKLIPFDRHDFYKFYNKRRILASKLLKKGFYDSF